MPVRLSREASAGLARALLTEAGMAHDKAEVVAEFLTRTDEIGVTTHGLSLVPYYLPELKSGAMAADGRYEVVKDGTVAMVWDGGYLPGHWLMREAIAAAMERAGEHGMAAVAIRRSHHIGCLSTLTRIAAEAGFVCRIATSDPAGRWVAQFGGVDPVLTPNPWAVGYPADPHPVLIDTCASITTLSRVREHINSGTQFDHPVMLDGEGRPTTDPNVVNAEPKGTILPTGGADHGHKGYATGLMVEMLTQGLSGHGRASGVTAWGANVFLEVLDPEAFAGRESFVREVDFLNEACRASRPAPGVERVRVPGDRAYAALERSRTEGIVLPDEVWRRVAGAAETLGVPLPATL